MKNLKFHLLTGVVAATTFISCNQSDEFIPDVKDVQIAQEDNLIERSIMNLSSEDALKLARRFANNEYGSESRVATTIMVKDIQTVTSDTGIPLMYIVNYADNKGFTVISATKNYTPVLAYSDEGNLNVDEVSFTDNIIMDEYKTYIEAVVDEEIDSLRQRYAIDWSLYEKVPAIFESRAYSDSEIQQKLAEARTYYSSQGYEIHSLGAAMSLIPAAGSQTAEQRANGFINDICSHTPPQYDCMDVTLFLVKRTYDQHGPYLQTAWHQNYPYAVGTPYGTAGCMKIAVTQLMYYYKHPADAYNWNNIRANWGNYLADVTTEERRFMVEIGTQLNQVYNGPESTDISRPHMLSTFRNNDYLVEELTYNRNNAKEYIKSNIPLIMYGRKDNLHSHVWVCDGYRHPKVQYAAYMIEGDFGEYTFHPGMTDDSGEYFHMNMGSGTNMWYYQDNATYGGDNYSLERKMYPAVPNVFN